LQSQGLDRIVCSHCGKSLEAAPIIRSFFSAVLMRIREGGEFCLQHFGTFRLRTVEKGQGATRGLFVGRKTIAFRPSRAAKDFINEAEP
jgi:nucleoid DNA-binding protein